MTVHDHWQREQVFSPGRVPIHSVEAWHNCPVRPHDHAFVEIVAVLGGRADHVTQTGERPLRAGDVLVLRPGVWHGYARTQRLRIFNCCFGHELLNRELAWTLEDPTIGPFLWGPRQGGGAIHFQASLTAVRRCAAEFGAINSPDGWAGPVGRLLVFLASLSQAARVEHAAPAVIPQRVVDVVRQIEANISRNWRMADLVDLTGVDASYLTRTFTAAMGIPPMAYLARCRAERAAALLIQTSSTIADIATVVGWEDPVYFARRFKQHYRVSPRAYRQTFQRSTPIV